MPHKTVTCKICGNEVSKRKSLAWEDGRACRAHDEVRKMIEEKALEEEQNRIMEEANEAMAFISAVAFVRVYHTMLRIPISVLMSRIPKKMHKKVLDEVEKQGAVMSSDEILRSMFLYDSIKSRARKVQEVSA